MAQRTIAMQETVVDIIARWAPYGRPGLLPCLIEVQGQTRWLSPGICRQIGEALGVPLADVFGLVSFHSLLYDYPVGRVIVRVCDDISCYINGSEAVLAACEHHLGLKPGQTSADGRFTLEVHPCLGRCERAPFMLVNTTEVGPVNSAEIPAILEEAAHE